MAAAERAGPARVFLKLSTLAKNLNGFSTAFVTARAPFEGQAAALVVTAACAGV
jgi:hypothetical protein